VPPRSLARAARLALVLAPLALALACNENAPAKCPGVRVARVSLLGTRNVEPDPLAPEIPACAAAVGYHAVPIAVTGVLTQDADFPASPGAAFCPGEPAAVLFGAREGNAFSVDGQTGGAVLAGCGDTCVADLQVILRGTLAPPAEGVAGSFAGTYIERLSRAAGDCSGCTLPCDGRYDVSGDALP
jgi:hypothetical protein